MSELMPDRKVEHSKDVKDPRHVGARALESSDFHPPDPENITYAAKIGDVITFEDESGTDTVRLVRSGDATQDLDAVSDTSPFGQKLLGAVVGSNIKWRSPNGNSSIVTITDIHPSTE